MLFFSEQLEEERMRKRRLKIVGGAAVYHCINRTVNGAFLFDELVKERLRRQLWQVADFSGVEVLTYCLMNNHFHVLIRVPDKEEVVLSDLELVRRYAVLYPEPTPYQAMTVKYLRAILKQGGEEAVLWRKRLLARMHDVSEFMKTLKQRFTIWFNHTHDRYGTLWAERFKSTVVEGREAALRVTAAYIDHTHDRYGTLWAERFKSTVVEGREAALRVTAAYIDLNPVRAGIVEDPKDYRWSGYGDAVGGSTEAREGIVEAVRGTYDGSLNWRKASREYRQLLYCQGSVKAPGNAPTASIPMEEWLRVLEEGGELPVAAALRCRVRYFADGAVLGSKEFVESIFLEYRDQFGRRRRSGARKMKGSDWEGLTVLRDLRRRVFGQKLA